jgi:hypothetical protein
MKIRNEMSKILLIALICSIWTIGGGCGQDPGESVSSGEVDVSCRVTSESSQEACTGPQVSEYYCDAFGGEQLESPTTIGLQQPFWTLQDLQPQSCGFEQYYGLEAFRGTPTMVVLLWAGCGFCQAQTEKLQQMHYELDALNIDVHFVIVDRSSDDPPIENLTNRCDFPIFQDEAAINAWGLQGGVKDDFYFYDSNGVLQNFIPATDDVILSSYEDPPIDPTSGYTNIKNAVLALVAAEAENPANAGSDVAADEP